MRSVITAWRGPVSKLGNNNRAQREVFNMGQRHQIYIVEKRDGKYTALGAFHHQWKYGVTAASDLVRLHNAAALALSGEYGSYHLRDAREIDVLVKSIYGVDTDGKISMVHNEADCLINDNREILAARGDNNDGCSLLVIDRAKNTLRACLFAINGLEAKRKVKDWVPLTPKQYTGAYYTDAELSAYDNRERVALITETKLNSVTKKEFDIITKERK